MDCFICTADSYGHIDYGIPVSRGARDYRTATEIATKYIPVFHQQFIPEKFDCPLKPSYDQFVTNQDKFNTTYSLEYQKKYQIPNANEQYKKALDFRKVLGIKYVQEKFFNKPPQPRGFPITEVKSQYVIGELPNVPTVTCRNTMCKLSSSGREEQPRVHVEYGGSAKLLDPYVTNTRLTHYPFTEEQKTAANSPVATYYNTTVLPVSAKKPVYDKVQFNCEIRDRVRRKTVCRIPHRGMESEYQESYYPPSSSHFSAYLNFSDVSYTDSLSGPNQSQTLAAPNMYCTEICQVGTGRSVRHILSQKGKGIGKLKSHKPCHD